jgi:cytidylate kinase
MNYQNITISGKICTGKTTLRNLLSKKLGWQTFSTGELFRQYVKENNLSLEQAEEQNDKLTKKIDGQVKELLRTKKKQIIDSWLAGITARGIPGVLKILLICKDDIRYKRFAKREKTSYQEAKLKVDERFQNWSKKIYQIYKRRDFFQEKYFDLIIDTSYITPQAALKKVINTLA